MPNVYLYVNASFCLLLYLPFFSRSPALPLFAALCHSRTPSASEATTTASDNRGNDDQDDDDAAAAAPDEWLDGDDGKQAAYYDSAFVLGRLSNL